MEENIKKILKDIGMQPNWTGYKMWVTAIKLKREKNIEKMEAIYALVCRKHKSTRSKTERAMRYAVTAVGKSKIQKYFDVNFKITNSVFIELLYEMLFMKQEKMSK